MSDIKYYTQEGLDKLKDDLHQLVSVERPSISKQIAELFNGSLKIASESGQGTRITVQIPTH